MEYSTFNRTKIGFTSPIKDIRNPRAFLLFDEIVDIFGSPAKMFAECSREDSLTRCHESNEVQIVQGQITISSVDVVRSFH
jgi:hypothetical protein